MRRGCRGYIGGIRSVRGSVFRRASLGCVFVRGFRSVAVVVLFLVLSL